MRTLNLTTDDRLAWARYEAKARAAAIEYAALPSITVGLGSAHKCIRDCGSRTYHQDRVCKTCRVNA